jgi:hypothetical protein
VVQINTSVWLFCLAMATSLSVGESRAQAPTTEAAAEKHRATLTPFLECKKSLFSSSVAPAELDAVQAAMTALATPESKREPRSGETTKPLELVGPFKAFGMTFDRAVIYLYPGADSVALHSATMPFETLKAKLTSQGLALAFASRQSANQPYVYFTSKNTQATLGGAQIHMASGRIDALSGRYDGPGVTLICKSAYGAADAANPYPAPSR